MRNSTLFSCITILIVILGLQNVSGQWLYNGTHIYNGNAGNVGIGNNAPTKLLDVGKNMTEPTAVVRNLGGSGGATFEMIDVASGADWKFKATAFGGFKIRDNANSLDYMTFEPGNGYIGIGKSDPASRLDVDGNFKLDNSTNYSFITIDHSYDHGQSGLHFTNQGADRGWIYFDEDDSLLRFSANHTMNADYALVITKNSNVGVGIANPLSPLEVHPNNNNVVRLAREDFLQRSYFYNREVVAEGDGQSAILAFRSREAQNDGIGYASGLANTAMIGHDFYGDSYCFGIIGYNYNAYNRAGGILGANETASYWGSLGYRNSGSTNYGGYFTSYTSGAGKAGQQPQIGIGIGAWGDLFGADIHGKLYGVYAEGEHYAMFSNGTVYKNDLDVHLQADGTGKNTVLYTYVSTDVCVQTSGTATLSSGSADIQFDPAFTTIASKTEPVVITVTPIGECNGIHLKSVSASGFTIAENNAGKSNVTVNYIAIGKRAGYENPGLAAEVVDAQYTTKLSQGLHADADMQTDGKGLYYENGQLEVGIHPSTIPDISSRKEETIIKTEIVSQQKGISDNQKPGEPFDK
ncbi:MAG: hypothetical protein KBC43_11405 [Bacteroidales bacterium]|nr:hypothetical protein [Bacteroidales bacterium]